MLYGLKQTLQSILYSKRLQILNKQIQVCSELCKNQQIQRSLKSINWRYFKQIQSFLNAVFIIKLVYLMQYLMEAMDYIYYALLIKNSKDFIKLNNFLNKLYNQIQLYRLPIKNQVNLANLWYKQSFYRYKSEKLLINKKFSSKNKKKDDLSQVAYQRFKKTQYNLGLTKRKSSNQNNQNQFPNTFNYYPLDLIALLKKIADRYYSLCSYNCQQAIQQFKRLPPNHFNTGWVLTNVGRAYMEIVKHPEAATYYQQAYKIQSYRLQGVDYNNRVSINYHLSLLRYSLFKFYRFFQLF